MSHGWRGVCAVLACAALGAIGACQSTVSGDASFGGDRLSTGSGPTGGGLDDGSGSLTPSGSPSGQPTGSPTLSPSSIPTGAPSSGRPTGSICRQFTPAFLRSVFGATPKVTADGRSTSCTLESGDVYIILNELPNFTVTEQKHQYKGADIAVAGHPGAILAGTEDGYLVVAESHDPSADGVLKAYTSRSAAEQRVGLALLAKLMPIYSTN